MNDETEILPPEGVALERRNQDEGLDIQAFRARVDFEKERIAVMKDFISGQMAIGTHYAQYKGWKKPSLLKPGAELLTNIHGMNPRFEETERFHNREMIKNYERYGESANCRGYVKYSYRCTLHRTLASGIGVQVGEGVGTCNNWEKKYLSVDMDDAENTIMKMAKKRAFIDAVLTATRTSDFFTQDAEDMQTEASDANEDAPPGRPKFAPVPPAIPRQHEADASGDSEDHGTFPHDEEDADVISEAQHSRMWAMAFSYAKKEGQDKEFAKTKLNNACRDLGFGNTKKVTKNRYKQICAQFEVLPF